MSNPDNEKRAYASSGFRALNNKRLLKGLFYEMVDSDKSTCLYTLKQEDHLGFPSLRRLYLEMEDPTEYNFAKTYLESWDHWEMLLECAWFKPHVALWRKELEVKMKAEALARIKVEATNGGKNVFMASKYLLERGWEPKEGQGRTRGRPSKDEIKRATDELLKASENLDEDFLRVMRPN